MKGIFIVPSDYDSLLKKGVLQIVRQRSEGGLLQSLWTVHPFALHDRALSISPDHEVIERKQPKSARLRIVSWFRQVLHLLAVTFLIRRLVRQHSIDFVRANDPYFCGLIGYVATRCSPTKFCISIHADYDKMHEMDPEVGAPKILGSRRIAKSLEHFLLSRADRVLAITKYITEYAVRNGANRSRVRLFRHQIDLRLADREFQPVQDVGVGRPVVALVSRLSYQKSIMDLPALAEKMKELGLEFQIEVAGDGPQRAQLEHQLQNDGLQDCVRLLGFQSSEKVRELLSRAGASIVFIGGASLIEAAAAESPTVAYDCEWHSEIIEDGKTGLLVPEHDTSAAAHAVAKLLRDRKFASALGRALRERICVEYDEKLLLEVRRSVYRELVSAET